MTPGSSTLLAVDFLLNKKRMNQRHAKCQDGQVRTTFRLVSRYSSTTTKSSCG